MLRGQPYSSAPVAESGSSRGWWLFGTAALLLGTVLTQLALGADVLVLALSLICLCVGMYPLLFVGRDLYTYFAALFCFRYTGGVLFAKTLYLQPVDSLLRNPLESYALTTVLTTVVVGLVMIARRLDRRSTIFPASLNPEASRQLGFVAYLIGAAASVLVGLLTRWNADAANAGALFVISSGLMSLIYLGFAAEIIDTLRRSAGRSLVSPRLVGMVALTVVLALFLNVRSLAVNSVICIFLCGLMFRAIKARHVLLGAALALVFTTYVSPLALELRQVRYDKSAAEFASDVVELVARTVTEPGLIDELQRKDAFRARYESGTTQYDYFGDGSNILNRLAFVALLDSVYSQTKVLNPIGMRALTQEVFPRVLPSFLVDKEARPYGYGDWLSWEVGLIETGRVSYLSSPLPVEGIAVLGAILGVTLWPIIFMLPMLVLFGRISSFAVPTATSIFLLSAFHWELIEGASDTFIGVATRSIPSAVIPLWLLYWLWAQPGRSQSRQPTKVRPGRPPSMTTGSIEGAA